MGQYSSLPPSKISCKILAAPRSFAVIKDKSLSFASLPRGRVPAVCLVTYHSCGAGIQAASAERTAGLQPVNPSYETALTSTNEKHNNEKTIPLWDLEFWFLGSSGDYRFRISMRSGDAEQNGAIDTGTGRIGESGGVSGSITVWKSGFHFWNFEVRRTRRAMDRGGRRLSQRHEKGGQVLR